MWIIPSMPSPNSTNAPNLARLVTGASTAVPTGYFFKASSHGSPSACFRSDVDHTLDALAQLDERSELSQAGDRRFHGSTHRILLQGFFPRITQCLLPI